MNSLQIRCCLLNPLSVSNCFPIVRKKKDQTLGAPKTENVSCMQLTVHQRFSTWGTRNPGGTRTVHRGYAASSNCVYKIKKAPKKGIIW
jgi:hypothetical protein